MQIQAIETSYKGYRFRSRLEARWAVFFDALGIEWRYEMEGYELPAGRYLPDFYIPHLDCWIEIKGEKPTELEQEKVSQLASQQKKAAYLFFGEIPWIDDHGEIEKPADCAIALFEFGWDHDYRWCQCTQCGKFGIQFSGCGDRICARATCPTAKEYGADNTPALKAAYEAARSARFEYGENPA